MWERLKSRAKRIKNQFHIRLLYYIDKCNGENSIAQESNKVYIDTLMDDYSDMIMSNKKKFISYCIQMTENAKPKEIRLYGYNILSSISNYKLSQNLVLDELLNDIQTETDIEVIDAILNTVLKYKTYFSEKSREKIIELLNNSQDEISKRFINQFQE